MRALSKLIRWLSHKLLVMQHTPHQQDQQLAHALIEQLRALPPIDPTSIVITPTSLVGYSLDGNAPYSAYNVTLRIQDTAQTRTVWSGSFLIPLSQATDRQGRALPFETILSDLWSSPEVQIRARRILHADQLSRSFKASSSGPLLPDSYAILDHPWTPPAS